MCKRCDNMLRGRMRDKPGGLEDYEGRKTTGVTLPRGLLCRQVLSTTPD